MFGNLSQPVPVPWDGNLSQAVPGNVHITSWPICLSRMSDTHKIMLLRKGVMLWKWIFHSFILVLARNIKLLLLLFGWISNFGHQVGKSYRNRKNGYISFSLTMYDLVLHLDDISLAVSEAKSWIIFWNIPNNWTIFLGESVKHKVG